MVVWSGGYTVVVVCAQFHFPHFDYCYSLPPVVDVVIPVIGIGNGIGNSVIVLMRASPE